MKLTGFLLLLAGWTIVVAAVALLPSSDARVAFLLAGLATEFPDINLRRLHSVTCVFRQFRLRARWGKSCSRTDSGLKRGLLRHDESRGASEDGTVFKMTPAGTVTLLHSFTGTSDGSMPIGALVQASDGNIYGTCYSGGANGTGTVFRITTKGVFTKIYDFAAEVAPGNIGYLPRAGLIQASDGNLYGTAWDHVGDSRSQIDPCSWAQSKHGLRPLQDAQQAFERTGIKIRMHLDPASARQDHGQPATRFVLLRQFPGGQLHRHQPASRRNWSTPSLPPPLFQMAIQRAETQPPTAAKLALSHPAAHKLRH